MDISNLITHLQAECPSAAQILKAEDVSRDSIDTSLIIHDLLNVILPGNVYPSRFPEDKVFPSLIYQLVSSNKVTYSQFNIFQTDVFVLYYETKTYSELITLRDQFVSALVNYNVANTAGDIEITDESIKYLPGQEIHQCAIELNIVHVNGLDQSLPSVLVYELADKTDDNEMINTVAQWKEVELSFNIIAKHDNLETIRNEVENAVLGYKENSYGSGAYSVGGKRLESLVNITLWEQRYKLKQRPLKSSS